MCSSCMLRSSLAVANGVGASTIAFPAISCGVYGYPLQPACAVGFPSVGSLFHSCPCVLQYESASSCYLGAGALATTAGMDS